jgi:IPT/TIG domain-containing protein
LAYFCGVNGECVPGVSPGGWPIGLIQATNGDFYGVTELYGGAGLGTAYQLSVGLGPFVKTLPTFGRVGRAITIFGTDLAGVTGVTFNGTAATFKVVSASAISATVPAGATSGQVEVTTPNGTLSSNPDFRVTQ